MVSLPCNIEYDFLSKILWYLFPILHGYGNHVKSEIGIDNRKSIKFDISCDRLGRSGAANFENRLIFGEFADFRNHIVEIMYFRLSMPIFRFYMAKEIKKIM